jgi:DNA-binding XRE family transcriptional regulator
MSELAPKDVATRLQVPTLGLYGEPMPSPTLGTRVAGASTDSVPGSCTFNKTLFMARTSAILGDKATWAERAAHVGIARSFLGRLCAGDIGLSMRRAREICRVLDVTIDELFPESGQQVAKTAA